MTGLDAREPHPRFARLAVVAEGILAAAKAEGLAACAHTEAALRAAGWP